MTALVLNIVVFKLGWLACVMGGAYGLPWLGTLVVPAIVAVHLTRMQAPRRELALILIAGAIGAVWESLVVVAGLLEYRSGMIAPGLTPHWIVAMWVLFGTTLNVALRWMKRRWLVAALMGAVAGPTAFLAGERLGAVTFLDPVATVVTLAIGWGLLMPLLMLLSERFDGHVRPVPVRAGTVRGIG